MTESRRHDRPIVFIASPLQPELVGRIRDQVPEVEVLFDPNLLPTPRYPCDHSGDPDFHRTRSDQSRFEDWLGRCEVMFGVPGNSPAAIRDAITHGKNLRWIQGTAAGEGQKLREAGLSQEELHRVSVTTAGGVHADQLAEWAVFGLLAFTKALPRLTRDKRARHWDHYPVRELRGQHLIVIGLGHIGQRVAQLASGLGMRVDGVRRHTQGPSVEGVDNIYATHQLPQLLPTVDAVVLTLPDTPHTIGLFSRDLINVLPEHAIVVNIGRGTTVDQAALISALQGQRLAGAALDVFAIEPLPSDSPLWTLDNVLLSPHTAALSSHENQRIVELFIGNLRRYLDGEDLQNRIDTSEFY